MLKDKQNLDRFNCPKCGARYGNCKIFLICYFTNKNLVSVTVPAGFGDLYGFSNQKHGFFFGRPIYKKHLEFSDLKLVEEN